MLAMPHVMYHAQRIDLDSFDGGANSLSVARSIVPPDTTACNQVMHQPIPPAQLTLSIKSTRSNS